MTGKKLSNNDFVRMFETIRSISTSAELGCGVDDTVSRNYEQGILVRGMIVLREDIKEKPGHQFLYKVPCILFVFMSCCYPFKQFILKPIFGGRLHIIFQVQSFFSFSYYCPRISCIIVIISTA